MNYQEKLKDPRWQKKRLKVLQRDNWTCQLCESKDKTLHVHHKYYLPNAEPWDVPDSALVTLCFECHEGEEQLKVVQTGFLHAWFIAGLLNVDMEGISGYVSEIKLNRHQLSSLLSHLSDSDFASKAVELMRDHIANMPKQQDDLQF